MNNSYKINEISINNLPTGKNQIKKETKVETVELDMDTNNKEKIQVLESLKTNLKSNRELTNYFNQELYKRVNDELKNLAQDEVYKKHAA